MRVGWLGSVGNAACELRDDFFGYHSDIELTLLSPPDSEH